MEYLPPDAYPLWKTRLRDGLRRPGLRRRGRGNPGPHPRRDRRRSRPWPRTSQPTQIFYDIRLEPYLIADRRAHPDLADTLQALTETTLANKRALVHGDVSPKNILAGRTARCSSTPNAPGGAIRPSTWPSA